MIAAAGLLAYAGMLLLVAAPRLNRAALPERAPRLAIALIAAPPVLLSVPALVAFVMACFR